jgi:hypothetical protein
VRPRVADGWYCGRAEVRAAREYASMAVRPHRRTAAARHLPVATRRNLLQTRSMPRACRAAVGSAATARRRSMAPRPYAPRMPRTTRVPTASSPSHTPHTRLPCGASGAAEIGGRAGGRERALLAAGWLAGPHGRVRPRHEVGEAHRRVSWRLLVRCYVGLAAISTSPPRVATRRRIGGRRALFRD